MVSYKDYDNDFKKNVAEYAQTHTRKEASEKFGVPISTLGLWAALYKESKLGIVWKPLNEINNQEEIYEYAKKYSPKKASLHFKLSCDNIYGIIQKYNGTKNSSRIKNKKNEIEQIKYGNIEIEEPEEKKIEPTPEPTKQKSKIAIMISDDPEAILNILKGL